MPGARWATITQEAELAAWEKAWRGEAAEEMGPKPNPIFLPALLAHAKIALIAAFEGPQIVAGAIASHTGQVVGLSNIFGPASASLQFRAGCIAAAITRFPGLPLVGYEAGLDLAEMQALGFEAIGPVRIWVRS